MFKGDNETSDTERLNHRHQTKYKKAAKEQKSNTKELKQPVIEETT